MRRFSSGLLPYRITAAGIEVFLVHMGGPYWEGKGLGAWSIAKGEYDPGDESPRDVARREFLEEVGRPPPEGDYLDLGETRMPSGKRVQAYAVQTAEDLAFVASNLFVMEWPPRSGTFAEFPEVDGAAWFLLDTARTKIVSGQLSIIETLARALS